MKHLKKTVAAFLALMLIVSVLPDTGISREVTAEAAKPRVYLTVGEKGTIDSYGNFTENGTNNPIYGTKWSSSKKSVLKISKKGVVSAKKKGTAVITAKQGKRKVFSAKVTVEQPKISRKTINFVPGQQAIPISVKGTKQNVSWSVVSKAEAESNTKTRYINGYNQYIVSLSPDSSNSRKCIITPDASNVGDVVVKATVGRGNVKKDILKATVHVSLRKVDESTITKEDYDYVTEDGQYGTVVILTNNNDFAVRSTVKLQFYDDKGYINMGGGESGITKVIEPKQKALFNCTSNYAYTRHEDTVNTTGARVADETDYVKDLHYWIQNGADVGEKYKNSIVITLNTDDAKKCGKTDFGVLLFMDDGSPYYVYANASADFSNGKDRCLFTIPYRFLKDANGNNVYDETTKEQIKIMPDLDKSIMCINKGYGRD